MNHLDEQINKMRGLITLLEDGDYDEINEGLRDAFQSAQRYASGVGGGIKGTFNNDGTKGGATISKLNTTVKQYHSVLNRILGELKDSEKLLSTLSELDKTLNNTKVEDGEKNKMKDRIQSINNTYKQIYKIASDEVMYNLNKETKSDDKEEPKSNDSEDVDFKDAEPDGEDIDFEYVNSDTPKNKQSKDLQRNPNVGNDTKYQISKTEKQKGIDPNSINSKQGAARRQGSGFSDDYIDYEDQPNVRTPATRKQNWNQTRPNNPTRQGRGNSNDYIDYQNIPNQSNGQSQAQGGAKQQGRLGNAVRNALPAGNSRKRFNPDDNGNHFRDFFKNNFLNEDLNKSKDLLYEARQEGKFHFLFKALQNKSKTIGQSVASTLGSNYDPESVGAILNLAFQVILKNGHSEFKNEIADIHDGIRQYKQAFTNLTNNSETSDGGEKEARRLQAFDGPNREYRAEEMATSYIEKHPDMYDNNDENIKAVKDYILQNNLV